MFGNPAISNNASIVTASGIVKTGQGRLNGALCAQSSSMKISVYDGTDTSGKKLVDQMTLTAGNPYPMPVAFRTGLYVELVSGSGSTTFFWD